MKALKSLPHLNLRQTYEQMRDASNMMQRPRFKLL